MLIVCPSCATSYDVGLASLSPNGRQVRCARCRTVWHAELSQSEKLFAAAAAIAPTSNLAGQAAGVTAEQAMPTPGPVAETAAATSSDHTVDKPAADAQTAEEYASASAGPAELSSSDADSGTEVQAPPIVPAAGGEAQPPIDVPVEDTPEQAREPTEDIETVAARRRQHSSKRRTPGWPLSRLQTGMLALALINILLVGWRSDVVRALPQTASFYALVGLPVNLRGLTFNNVATSMEQHEGVPILVIEGDIVNSARRTEDVPHLKFVVRNAARQEIYSWTAVPSRNVLAPGEAVSFRARLASPPPDAQDFILRFVNRRDIVAATR